MAGCAWPLTSSSFAESAIIGLAGRIEVPSPSAGRRTPVSSERRKADHVLVGERADDLVDGKRLGFCRSVIVAHAFENPTDDGAGVPREPLGRLGGLEFR